MCQRYTFFIPEYQPKLNNFLFGIFIQVVQQLLMNGIFIPKDNFPFEISEARGNYNTNELA